MITTLILLIVGLILLVLTILDLKYKSMPSIFPTALIFVLAFVKFENLQFALLSGILALLMYEFAYENDVGFGMADIKVMIALGFLIPSINSFFTFTIVFMIGQLFYTFMFRKYWKQKGEIPFIPLLFMIFVAGAIWGVFA